MIKKILIANRGEIACRIIRTAKTLGIATVAVYSDQDNDALFVQQADQAFHIGPAPSSESYLKIDTIIQVAKQAEADAIHPGYGFLAENSEFALACENNNIIFIGPKPQSIEDMGSKSKAKQIMAKADVPLIPGYYGKDQSLENLQTEADKIGYPLLIKASKGGGGKGMRLIEASADFAAGLAACQREAKKSFADSEVLLEKYLVNPRHIEIQVFADQHNNCVYLFDRDCSIQRRHQKVIEEAPSPNLPGKLREQMGGTAVKAALSIGYIGAGTFEFLVDADHNFYFMEMNTRLQVEHPVTEMITGTDLVAWQIQIANGEQLPCKQSNLNINGHAIEVRLYAEDPNNDFLPSTGRIAHLRFPQASDHVRIDSGIQEADLISPYYDPMLAKLIVWDQTREACLQKLQHALAEVAVVGVKTNNLFLHELIQHPEFQAANINTHFIEDHSADLFKQTTDSKTESLALATLYTLLQQDQQQQFYNQSNNDITSPWGISDAWRLNTQQQQTIEFIYANELYAVQVNYLNSSYSLEIPGAEPITVKGELKQHELNAELNSEKQTVSVIQNANELNILGFGFHHILSLQDLQTLDEQNEDLANRFSAPMPGTIIAIHVEPGETIQAGTPLITLEAMKMEHTMTAPQDGAVTKFNVKPGDLVTEGSLLLEFE